VDKAGEFASDTEANDVAIIGRPDEGNDSDSQPRPLSSAYGLFAIFRFLR
jgi:hypothetical protein